MDAFVQMIWWPSCAVVSTFDSLVSHTLALLLQTLALPRDLLVEALDVLLLRAPGLGVGRLGPVGADLAAE